MASQALWGERCVGEDFVGGSFAAELAGEDRDFVDEHGAGVEIGEAGQFVGQRTWLPFAAGASECEVGDEAALFAAIAALSEAAFDGSLECDHFLRALPCPEPQRARA